MSCKKIYIVADLEGCVGVSGPDKDSFKHSYIDSKTKYRMATQCTRELNAMIEGLRNSHCDEILVVEGHPGCIIYEQINDDHIEIRYPGDDGIYLPKSEQDWSGVYLLGHHVKEGTKNGFLAHTMSIKNPQKWYINGQEEGEVGIIHAWMAEARIPLLHVTGGNLLQNEINKLNSEIKFTKIKYEYGFLKAEDLPVDQVLDDIKVNSARALLEMPIQEKEYSMNLDHNHVYRKFVIKTPIQYFKVFSYVLLKWVQSRGIIRPKGLSGHEVKTKTIRSAINMLLGFKELN